MPTRIKNFITTAATIASDDYLPLDGTTNSTRKMLGSVFATQAASQASADGMIFGAGSAAAPKLAIGTAGNGIYASAANTLDFTTNGAQKWQITSAGILQSPGAGTIGTATGALVIQTAGGNGNIRLVTNGTGLAGVNVTTPVTALHVGTSLTTSPRGIMSAQYTTDALGARIHMRKARGTEAVPTIVVTGDDLGRLQWAGYDGVAYLEMASIRAAATGTVTNPNRVPTQLIFSTATDASPSVLTDVAWLTAAGRFSIGTASPGAYALTSSQATGQCLDLIYNAGANHASFVVSSGGNLTITASSGVMVVASKTTFNDDITPSASGSWDMGTTSLKWRNGWFNGTLSSGNIFSANSTQETSSIATGSINTAGGIGITKAVSQGGKTIIYNNVTTAGWGVPAIYGANSATSQTAANASIATYTCGATDGTFEICANVLTTTSGTEAFTMECAYTDEGNTARVLTLPFAVLGGTSVSAINFSNGAVPYAGMTVLIRVKASTAITIRSQAAGTYTGWTGNFRGLIKQTM